MQYELIPQQGGEESAGTLKKAIGRGVYINEYKEIMDCVREGAYDKACKYIYKIACDREGEVVKQITGPEDLARRLMKYATMDTEQFVVVTVDGAHQIVGEYVATSGLLNRTMVHPREVFRVAIKDNSAAIFVAHNHPSGNTEPSQDDIAMSNRLKEAGEVIGIQVVDQLVLGIKEGKYQYQSVLESYIKGELHISIEKETEVIRTTAAEAKAIARNITGGREP